jgi:N-acetylneuraminic acid mutarotase
VRASDPIALVSPRARHQAVLLANGKILLAGGDDGTAVTTKSAELVDPATATSTATGPLGHARDDFAMVALDDGRALAIGGFNNDDEALGVLVSTELYDPDAGTWSPGPDLPRPRSALSAIKNDDGTVLVFGGGDLATSIEPDILVFHPDDDTFSVAAGTITNLRTSHTAQRMSDGRVLMVGGYFTGSKDDVDVIFPDGRALAADNIPGARRSACAANDDTGDTLVFGGLGGATTLDDVQRFGVTDNAWSRAATLTTPRFACEAVELSCLDLVCGGVDATSCEAYDFARGEMVPVLDDSGAEFSTTLTRIDDTHALLAGGFAGDIGEVVQAARIISLEAP